MTYFDDVGAFHEKFGLPRAGATEVNGLDRDTFLFRVGFMIEELAEFCEARGLLATSADLRAVGAGLRHQDLVHQEVCVADLCGAGDALCDLVYVALGTAHFMGLPFHEMWGEVQRANMAKERTAGADDPRSKRRHASDVVKPEGWVAPNHEPIILKAMA